MKKTFLKAILIIFFVTNFMNAQSQDPILQKLIDLKLIEQKEVKDFIKNQEAYTGKSTTSYLYALFQCEYKRITKHFYSTFIANMISIENDKLSDEEQKKENQELSDYLSKLKSCELLSEKQSQYFQKEISNNSYGYKLQFIQDITFKALKADYMAPEKLKDFADKLKDYKIVDTKYQSLIAAIDEEKIEEPIDFLLYCEKSTIINPKNYSDKVAFFLEAIHKKTASVLPELAFTDFEYKIVLDPEMSAYGDNYYNCIVSLKSNGKIYKQKSGFYPSSKNDYSAGEIDIQNYYQIFNKILIDLHAPYRVHDVPVHGENASVSQIGIMVLTEEQEKKLNEFVTYINASQEDFKNKPTSQEIENAIDEYTKIGLFSNLTADQISHGKEKVRQENISNYNDILSAFPNMIYSFDTELGNLEDPYAELIKEFAAISHNEFKPTHISNLFDIEKSKKTTLKFKLKNKVYSKTFKIDNDWIDADFFDFVRSVTTKNNLEGRFYELYTGGQDAKVIFLTENQYNYIRTNKLLLFADQEWEEE
ncbi:hypothetical protein HNP37_002881 [Flavobacterium nitrogenifigens]|uniref:Uncharacterized protein n=2 Tax=Flavobacterium TaxID=237 RepID=A0A7W7IY94_9FLAO|nr:MULTISPECIES: hypothetical protein [Flavobacterium]MBB4802806.1 hypothetical protein [Flavobacterium nitrogenifigens]MBB6387764.1 hypothetical protein [Flavobacterium notoginsengisoli]